MCFAKAAGILFVVTGLLLLGFLAPTVRAQTATQSQANLPKAPQRDDLQRSVRIYNYKMTAESGPQRGEVIYFYKCWMCHNKYTKSAPYLADIFQRSKLVSGEPVSENTVREKIRNGGPRMPAFRYALNDADLADLLGYLRGGKCCYEEEEPPANPWYHRP